MRTFGDTLRRLRTATGLTQGELAKQAEWSQSQISRTEQNLFTPDDATVQRLDRALDANGRLIAASATVTTSSADPIHPGRDPLIFSDLLRKIHRTDVGRDTIDQLTVITEQLCCEYASRRPEELREDAHHQLDYLQRLLEGPTRLSEHRELLIIAGWLSLLIGCLNYDLGLARRAETARTATFQLGREAGHGEIIAWSFEMSAWFALTQGRLRSVLDYADAGINAAPQAMDCYRIAGDDTRAAEHAHEVLHLSHRPDGSDRSPMRATEARLTLAIVSLRNGDIDHATAWAHKAFQADRTSVNSLSMITDELYHAARTRYGDDPAITALNDVISYTSIQRSRDPR
ncbi:MAG: helix-turn-helix domain-containing protein [Pseudonocardiaceae bacterium]